MKKIKYYIFVLLLFCTTFIAVAQSNKDIGYYIENEEVVFVFDVKDYNQATSFNGQKLDFADLSIDEVALSGEFNNWSEEGWRMQRINETRFELRKNLEDFNDKFSWQFKYVVNNFYWAEPSKKDLNAVKAERYGYYLGVYNLQFFTATPSKSGNALFELDGYNNATKVVLSGTFNFWSEEYFEMKNVDNGWQLNLLLPPGQYEYKFIVDGSWISDPLNPRAKWNEHGSLNSVIDITSQETFKIEGFKDAKDVVLTGDFNNWSESRTKLKKTETGWEITLELSAGKHHYKFIVDGNWILDPINSVKEYDAFGNINSVRIVK